MNHTGTNPPSNPKTKAVAIIPARYDSVRLPGKTLLEIAGKPMICWVVERALAARNVDRAIVATDDERIASAVRSAGCEAVMTSAEHRSGTDRIAEVAASIADADIIVNVQGDEPLISTLTIERAIEAMGKEVQWEKGERGKGEKGKWDKGEQGKGERKTDEIGIVTTWEPMETAADVLNPDVVKMVVDDRERAVYFSRSPVPYPRDAVSRHGSIEAAIFAEPALLTSFRNTQGCTFTAASGYSSLHSGRSLYLSYWSHSNNCERWNTGSTLERLRPAHLRLASIRSRIWKGSDS